jgi:hypothetical protein
MGVGPRAGHAAAYKAVDRARSPLDVPTGGEEWVVGGGGAVGKDVGEEGVGDAALRGVEIARWGGGGAGRGEMQRIRAGIRIIEVGQCQCGAWGWPISLGLCTLVDG